MSLYKRVISFILSALLIFGAMGTFGVSAAASPTLSTETKSVSVGDQFTIDVLLTNTSSVYGGNFTMQYDNTLLTAESYSFGSVVGGHTKNCNLNYQSAGNLIRFTFSGAEALPSDGTLVTITFTAKATGTANLSFTAYKMYDENGSSIASMANGSQVTITAEAVISPVLSVTNKTVTVGETVTVPVVISNSDDVFGGNFTLQYDNTLLTADSYSFGSIVSGHTKNCNLNYQSAGNLIRFTFSGAEALSSDGTLVTITFTANASGTANLQFNAYKMYDENGTSISTVASNGTVEVEPQPTPPAKELVSVEISSKPTKTSYEIYESLDTSGLKLKLTYSDNSTETITSGFSVSGFSSTTAGTKTVTVTYQGYNDTFTVVVKSTVKTPSITLSKNTLKLDKGTFETITATTNPVNQTITWVSSNANVATVVDGKITAKNSGTTTITAKFVYNGAEYSSTCQVNVRTMTGIAIHKLPNKTVFYVGDGFRCQGLELKRLYDDGSYEIQTTFNYTSHDQVAMFMSTGKSNVTVYCEGYSTVYEIEVLPISANLLTEELNLNVGDTAYIEYKTDPSDISNFTQIIWKSSDTSIVTVDSNGKVRAVGSGTAKITLTVVHYGVGFTSNECVVTVGKEVNSISVEKVPSKTTYYIGDSLNTSGLELLVTYDDGSSETVTSGFATSGFSSTAAGTKTVTVTYQGYTDTFTVTVKTPSITLSSGSKTMLVGDTSSITATTTPSGQAVTWTSSNTSVATVSGGTITAKASGSATITAEFTYNGKTYSETCSVIVESIVVSGITVKSNPTKTSYYVGDTLDTNGLALTATYNNGTTQTISSGFSCTPTTLNTAGAQKITVTYGGKTTSFNVTVADVALSSIAVKSNPTKTSYYVGDTLNTSGLTLTTTYNNGTTQTISSGFTCTPTTLSTAGTQKITVTYGGKTTSFNVTVADVVLSSIAVKSNPAKTSYYVGDTLNTSGLTLTATYNNGTTKIISSGFTCTPTTLNTAGTQKITVTYGGKTTSFNVTVADVALSSVTVKSNPAKTSYYVGDTLNTSGLTLTATYNNGTTQTISSGFTCTPTTLNTAGTQKVTVTYDGKSTSFNVNVSAVQISEISIASVPGTLSYYVGDTLSTEGLSILVSFNNGTTKTITSGFTCTPTTLNAEGTQKITVTYGGKTATFNVLVSTVKVTELEIVTVPQKTSYKVGDKFDPTGLTMNAVNSKGETIVVTEGFVCTPEILDKAGTHIVTVSYGGKSVMITVVVGEVEPETYTVRFIADGNVISETEYEVGATIVKPSAPAKVGYKFTGWDEEVPSAMPSEDLTFTAQYELLVKQLKIKNPSTNTVKYGETLVMHADIVEAELPEGWTIEWTVEGAGFSTKVEENGLKLKVTSVASGNPTVKATLVDENGEAVLDADGNEMSDSKQLKSDASFWQKIVSFFKNLFGISRIILQSI